MSNKLLASALCFLLAVVAAAAQTLAIDSCYALAVRNYPLIKQYDLIEKTKDCTLSNAGKAYLPELSITGIGGIIFGLPTLGAPAEGIQKSNEFHFVGMGQFSQTIWDGGAAKTQKDIAKASYEADKASLDVSLYELRARVNQLYFGILLLDEQLAQLAVQDTILRHNVARIKQLNDNGLAYKTDLDEIKVEQLKLEQRKTELVYTRKGYVLMLSLLIGAKIGDETALQKPAAGSEVGDLQIIRPELSLFKSQRDLITAQSGFQRVRMMPKIGLLGAAAVMAPGIDFLGTSLTYIGVAGLSASWKLSGLYKTSNEKQLTLHALSKVNVQEETFLFNTKLRMTQASADIEKQKAILAADEEIASLRKSLRESYQLKYDTGMCALIDLLNATEKESEALRQKALHEMQLLMTIYDYKTITAN